MPVLSLSPSANLLNVAVVPTHGMGTGISILCSPTESTLAPVETSNGFHWRGVMQTLSAHHGCFPCCYIYFILGDRINDPSNEYLKLPFFFSLIGKTSLSKKLCAPVL